MRAAFFSGRAGSIFFGHTSSSEEEPDNCAFVYLQDDDDIEDYLVPEFELEVLPGLRLELYDPSQGQGGATECIQ